MSHENATLRMGESDKIFPLALVLSVDVRCAQLKIDLPFAHQLQDNTSLFDRRDLRGVCEAVKQVLPAP
jgi:hypothetical protein